MSAHRAMSNQFSFLKCSVTKKLTKTPEKKFKYILLQNSMHPQHIFLNLSYF